MTRLFADPPAIAVETDTDGVPLRFVWEEATHTVLTVTDRWTVDSEWWTRRLWRSYFQATTDTGMLVEIYQDLLTNEWAIHRLYD